jgi:hypothetical protein
MSVFSYLQSSVDVGGRSDVGTPNRSSSQTDMVSGLRRACRIGARQTNAPEKKSPQGPVSFSLDRKGGALV